MGIHLKIRDLKKCFRAFHRCKEKEELVIAAASDNSKVADNYITTRRGFRAVSRTDPEHVYCYTIETEDIDTSCMGLNLPWNLVGAAR